MGKPIRPKQGYYECKYCKKRFTNYNDYLAHQVANLWERHIHKRRDYNAFYCDICGRDFVSFQSFLDHWDEYHDNYAASLFYARTDYIGDDSFFVNRPTEKHLLLNRIHTERHLRALRRNESAETFLKQEIEYGPKHMSNTISIVYGIPGMGKSTVALALASIYQRTWRDYLSKLWNRSRKEFRRVTWQTEYYEPKVYVGFSMAHTVNFIKKARAGDTVIQDEDPRLSGADSKLVARQLINIQNILRRSAINLIFVTPFDLQSISIPNYILEVVGRDDENRRNLCIYYDRFHVAVGWVVIHILPDDHPFMRAYEKMKEEYVKRITQSGGSEVVEIDRGLISDYAYEVTKYAFEQEKAGRWKIMASRKFVEMVIDELFSGKVVGQTREYVIMLARQLIQNKIMERRVQEKHSSAVEFDDDEEVVKEKISNIRQVISRNYGFVHLNSSKFKKVSVDMEVKQRLNTKYKRYMVDKEVWSGFVYELIDEYMDDEVDPYLEIFKKVHDVVYDRKLKEYGFDKYKPEYFDMWYDYFVEQMTFTQIEDKYGVRRQDIGKRGGILTVVHKEIIGYIFEEVVKNAIYPKYETKAGFHEPDFVSPDGKIWVEAKIRTRDGRRDRPMYYFADDFELDALKSGKIDELRIVVLFIRPGKKQFQIWRVTYDPDEPDGSYCKGVKVSH